MKVKYKGIIMMFMLAALAGAGCSQGQAAESCEPIEESADLVTYRDALGQELTLQKPQRVVSLMGSFSEIWLLAGGADSLVGTTVDASDNRDLGIPEHTVCVGTYQNPNMEEVLSLDPELVLLSSETVRTDTHVAWKETLASAGISAAYFQVTYFEDYLNMLKFCTELTGEEEAYQNSGLRVQEEIQKIVKETTLKECPEVLLMITFSGGIRPQGSDTMTGRMLEELGCHNIIDDYPSLWKDFSIEQVMEIDPDYIFVIPMGNDTDAEERNLRETIDQNPAWSGLTAVKNGCYHLLPKELFLYKPNDKWAESYRYLAELLMN